MAQKPNFLKKLISTGLVTASTVTMIAGFSGSAMGALLSTNGNVSTNASANWNPVQQPASGDTLRVANNGDVITFNTPPVNNVPFSLAALIINTGGNPEAATLTNSFSVGSIIGVAGGDILNITVGQANQSLTFTGTQGEGAAAGQVNVYTGLGTIDFANFAFTLNFTPANTANGITLGANAKVANAGNAAAILNVTNAGSGLGNQAKGLEVQDSSFATIKTINVADGSLLRFNSTSDAAGNANLTLQNGTTINLQGSGTLHLLAKAGGNGSAANFLVNAGTLGGGAGDGGDGNGIIHFDTTNAAGTFGTNAPGATAVVGTDNQNRAGQFIVTGDAGNANAATITNKIFAQNVTFNGGTSNFQQQIDVGAGGTATFKALSKTTLNVSSNLGAVDFGNTASQINVVAGQTLTGNFTGDANNNANTAGVITFAAAGTLANASADATVAVTNNITAIESAGAGIVNLSGIHNAELRLGNVGSIFNLADGTVINGGVNQTGLLGGANDAAGTITLVGDATITGNVGSAAVAPAAFVGNITLANDASKTLTLGGANILSAANNAAAAIIYGAAGGNVKLTNTQNNVVFNYNLTIATDQKGTFDASALTNKLTINGTIGAANLSLGKLILGSSEHVLNGNANINTVVMGSSSTLTLSDDGANAANFTIVQTTNAAGQGNVNINPTINNANNNELTLATGSSLGSFAKPLNTVKFGGTQGGAADVVLILGKGDNIYANTITNTTNNIGSFTFNGGGQNIVSGTVGGPGKIFNNVTVTNNTTAQFFGNAIFSGITEIDNGSTLQIGGNYTAGSIIGKAANNGTLQFINADPINVTLNTQGVPVNALAAVQVSGTGNVTFEANGNAANQGILFSTINFTDVSSNVALTLPNGVAFDNLTIASAVKNPSGNIPFVYSYADSILGANPAIGSPGNIVGLGFAADKTITVGAGATTLYAAFDTTKDGQGTVILSGGTANTAGTVYGLGNNHQLKLVTVTTNYNNLGNLNANVVVNDGLIFTTGGTFGTRFNGTITLGSANGNSNVVFADGIFTDVSSTVAALKANTGTVTYLGSAAVDNIGSASTPVASVKFNGAAGSTVYLQGATYAQNTDFASYNLIVSEPSVIIGGDNNINGNIELDTNSLTFASGTSTWGDNTSLDATLNVASSGQGTLGNIVIANGAQVNAQDVSVDIYIQDNASANFTTPQSYTFIQGGARFNGSLNSDVKGSNRFVAYGLAQAANGDYQLIRTNNVANVLSQSIASSPIVNTPFVSQNLAAFINPNNTGDAAAAYANSLLSKNSADDAAFLTAILTDTSAATANVNVGVAKEIQNVYFEKQGDAIAELRQLGTPESAKMASSEGGAAAAGDEPEDNVAYGAWAKPFYTHADQKERGGVAGYRSNTSGVVVGLDTLANDNLVIGAAIGVTQTDVKHQNYKKGDKTTIDGFSFSLYGAQQLVNDIFAQGSAIFSVNHVKNKSVRYMFDNNGNKIAQTASANYNNMTFGGNVMLGYDANVIEGVVVSPMAGLSYLRTSDESYKEKGTTFLNKQVNSKFGDRTDLIAGAKVLGGTMNITEVALYPEAHAFVVQKIGGKLAKVQSQLDGQIQPFIGQPDKTAKTTYNLGLSLSARPGDKMEYGIGYDANIANKFVSHQGTLKVRVNF